MRRSITALIVILLAVPGMGSPSIAATPKVNTTCAKVGQTVTVKSSKLVCTKSGRSAIWKVARKQQPGNTGSTSTTATIGWLCTPAGSKAKTSEGVDVVCNLNSDGKSAWAAAPKVYGPKDAREWGMVRNGTLMNCAYSDGNQGFRILKGFRVDPTNPKKLIVGVEFDGIFRSDDAGSSWSRSSAGIWGYPKAADPDVPCITELSRIEIDPSDSNHVIVARAGGSRTIGEYFGENNGIYESKDGGKTWKQILLDLKLNIGIKHALCFAGPNGVIYGGTSMDPGQDGKIIPMDGLVIKSIDGGRNWSVLKTGTGEYLAAQDMFCSATDPNFVIVSTMQRLPGKTFTAGIGLIQTTDGGMTWTTLNAEVKIAELGVSSANPKNISIIQYDDCVPSYSVDGGRSFAKSSGLNCTRSVYYDSTDATGNSVWATSDEGRVYRSSDAGRTYTRVGDLTPFEGLTMYGSRIDFGGDGAVYVAGHYKGMLRGVTYQEPYIFRSTNSGGSWTKILGPDRLPGYVGIPVP